MREGSPAPSLTLNATRLFVLTAPWPGGIPSDSSMALRYPHEGVGRATTQLWSDDSIVVSRRPFATTLTPLAAESIQSVLATFKPKQQASYQAYMSGTIPE